MNPTPFILFDLVIIIAHFQQGGVERIADFAVKSGGTVVSSRKFTYDPRRTAM
jgi:hypothetical protein